MVLLFCPRNSPNCTPTSASPGDSDRLNPAYAGHGPRNGTELTGNSVSPANHSGNLRSCCTRLVSPSGRDGGGVQLVGHGVIQRWISWRIYAEASKKRASLSKSSDIKFRQRIFDLQFSTIESS